MFSKYRSTKLTFNCFYIVFDYYSFIKLQLNQYKLFLFLQWFIHQVLFFGVSKISFKISFKTYFAYCWLVCIIFIGSLLIDSKTYPKVWLQISSGPYPNCTYRFSAPASLCKVMTRVPVFLLHLFQTIHWLDSSHLLKFDSFLWIVGNYL